MIVQLQNLYFRTDSPSFYELSPDHYDMGGRRLDLSFVEDCWLLAIVEPGSIKTARYPTRDQAVAFIATAFNNVASAS